MTGVVSARLSVTDDRPFYGKPAWHLQAHLQTLSPLRYLYPVDDQFDSYAGHADLIGLQFEMYLHESGKSENHILHLSSAQTPAPAGTTQVQVLPGTRDPLGFIYYLRTVDWQKTPEVRSTVFDGQKLYTVVASVATPRSEIKVQAGTFTATGLGFKVLDRGTEITNMKITLWLAQDEAHTPVLIELALPFGSGRVELVKSMPGR